MKIAKAGTPYPSNDAECLGYLLEDVDVTQGDAPGTYVFLLLLKKYFKQFLLLLKKQELECGTLRKV